MDEFKIVEVPRVPKQATREFEPNTLNIDIGEIVRHVKIYLETPLPIFRDEAYRLLDEVRAYCAGVDDANKYSRLAKNTLSSLPKFQAAMDRAFQSRDMHTIDEMFGAFEIEPNE